MNPPLILQRLSSDVPKTFYHINDLALDEDCEIFLHLGGWRLWSAIQKQKPLQGFWVSLPDSYGL